MNRLIIQFGRSNIILGLIVAVGLVFGYMSYSQLDDPVAILLAGKPVVDKDDIDAFQDFKIDFTILDDEAYKSLEIFGENPVDPGITGERKNPFAGLSQ
jgi:hypothetical protein